MSDSVNPYAAPQADEVAPRGVPLEQPDASQGTRFANLFIDLVVRFVLSAFLGGAMSLLELHHEIFRYGVLLLTMLGYYVVCESLFGWTVGKLITGTRVVTNTGHRPSFLQILGRTFARFVPFEPLSFFGSATGWHDRWSGTRVVRLRR